MGWWDGVPSTDLDDFDYSDEGYASDHRSVLGEQIRILSGGYATTRADRAVRTKVQQPQGRARGLHHNQRLSRPSYATGQSVTLSVAAVNKLVNQSFVATFVRVDEEWFIRTPVGASDAVQADAFVVVTRANKTHEVLRLTERLGTEDDYHYWSFTR